jgi:DNA-binding LacI/PurR family transcriptional regulator
MVAESLSARCRQADAPPDHQLRKESSLINALGRDSMASTTATVSDKRGAGTPRLAGLKRDSALKPRLDEVAALAGVSRATVSRVVNGSSSVSPEAKQAVDRAIAMLGYVPNRAARSLVTKRTETLGLIVSEPETMLFSDPFFATSVRGICSALSRSDLQLVLLWAQNDHEHEKAWRYVQQGHVDGVFLLSLHGDDPLPAQLRASGTPTVLLGRTLGDQRLPYVDADNRGGGRLATEHLLSRGRRKIATITGPMDMRPSVDRFEGYQDAMRDAGVRTRKSLVAHGRFTEESGMRAMRALLRAQPDLDAVFVASDLMAFGALRALAAAGRKVPDDVGVVGFDDVPFAEHTAPPLTTVRQPLAEMTKAMCDLLRKRIDGEGSDDDHVIAPTTLVERSSA